MSHSPVVHIVLVRWKREVSSAVLDELTEGAHALADAVPGVVDVACGPNTSPEGLAGGFDWALVVDFVSSAARDDYLPHPAHRPVAELITQWAEQVVVFDVAASSGDR
ncbi:Dabb family protein [Microbacterium sp. P02]|uniref:Dabb family protein n=1 Tax=unclassified Microbacterium TaxID=2609290 RepID=UPI00366C0120